MIYKVYLCEYETENEALPIEACLPSDAARTRVEAFERQRVEFKCAAGEEEITAMVYTGGKWRKIIVCGKLIPYYYTITK